MRVLEGLCDGLDSEERTRVGNADTAEAGARAIVRCLWRGRSKDTFLAAVDDLTSQHVQGCCPDEGVSVECKERGTTAFKAGDLKLAASEWTSALRFNLESSPEGRKRAAVLYSNRAQCMLKMGMPEAALSDASCAADIDPKHCKAWWRRATANAALGRGAEARRNAERALGLCEGKEADDIEKFVSSLTVHSAVDEERGDVRDCEGRRGAGEDDDGDDDDGAEELKLSDGVGERGAVSSVVEQGCLSDQAARLAAERAPRMRIAMVAGSGRGIVAGRGGVRAGQVVLTDVPLASVLHRSRRMTHCAVCLGALKPSCPVVSGISPLPLVCSLLCKTKLVQERSHELGRPWSSVLPDCALLALRLASAWSRHEAQPGDLEALLLPLSPAKRIQTAVLAAVSGACWQSSVVGASLGPVSLGPVSLGPVSLGAVVPDLEDKVALVLRALLVVETNSFAVCGAVRGGRRPEAWRVGSAVYPVASLLNHACRPTVCISFDESSGGGLVARAVCHLAEGEEASHCYGPQQGSATLEQRRHDLQASYHFSCSCLACKEEDKEEEGGGCRMLGVLCGNQGCQGWICAKGPECRYARHRGGGGACQECLCEDAAQGLARARDAVKEWEGNVKDRVSCAMREGKPQQALRLAEAWLQKLGQPLLHPAHVSIGEAHNACCMAQAAIGQLGCAADWCGKAVANLEMRYPQGGLVLALETAFYAALLARASRTNQAQKKAAEAAKVICLHYGRRHLLSRALIDIADSNAESRSRAALVTLSYICPDFSF